jgi:Raf kinase inhibitor-like YbhB/YbcL family protein
MALSSGDFSPPLNRRSLMRANPVLFGIIMAALAAPATAMRVEEVTMTITIHSTAFEHLGAIPAKYTCEGEDVSPPLQWQGVPPQAKSLVLIVDDPDAPDPQAPKMTYVHWVLYNLPPDSNGLPEAVHAQKLPKGTLEGQNDWKRTGYGGPCPPIGRHRYFFKLYALDVVLENMERPTKADLEAAIKGHVIAQSEIIGTYQKGQ